MNRRRDPDGVVHLYHDDEFLEPETICEYIDNRIYWPRQLLKDTNEHPTCVRCVARWR